MEGKLASETSPYIKKLHNVKSPEKEDFVPVLYCNCLIWVTCRVWIHQEQPYDILSLFLKIREPTVYYIKKCRQNSCSLFS